MRYDVVIVGGGPAGMSAAMRLKGGGKTVAVVERLSDAGIDRYHSVCGEAVSRGMFKRLGWTPGSIVRDVDAIGITFPGGVSVRVPVKGVIVDRPSMIREMRDLSDADIIRASVVSVERFDDGFSLALSDGSDLTCRYLVGADGAHSIVRREVFGLGVTSSLPIINCIAEGEADPTLDFFVGGNYAGGYSWRFPSTEGHVSIGFPKGCGNPKEVPGLVGWGARDLPFGVVDRVVDGNAAIIGDAACLANPLCYGGIGVALVSGRMIAEAILRDDLGRYADWVRKSPLFDRHFMEAHEQFRQWTDEDIRLAMRPFRRKYSVSRGILATLTHPRYANVYLSTYVSLRIGW